MVLTSTSSSDGVPDKSSLKNRSQNPSADELESEKHVTVAATASQSSKHTVHHRHRYVPPKSSPFFQMLEDNQMWIAAGILAAIHLPDLVLGMNVKFYQIHHRYPGTDLYDIGVDDVYFIVHIIVLMIFIRSFFMDFILGPIAVRFCNITSKRAIQRFKEQAWQLIYYSTSCAFGTYVYAQGDYYLNFDNMYLDWPYDQMTAWQKAYYLCEIGSWLQQFFILHIEARRKDHYQMFSHHIFTSLLVIGSYYYYFTKVGNVVLILMDFVDIFLCLAKVLRYCGFTTICDVTFVVFLLSWIVNRHIIYNYVVWHAATRARDLMGADCSALLADGIIPKRCYTDTAIDTFVGLLCALEVVALVWLYSIFKVFYRVVTGNGAEDVRSDSEDES